MISTEIFESHPPFQINTTKAGSSKGKELVAREPKKVGMLIGEEEDERNPFPFTYNFSLSSS